MATRRWFLATATSCAATPAFCNVLGTATPRAEKLAAWTELLTEKKAAARIGRVLRDELSTKSREKLLARQRARFHVAAIPSLALLQDMMAEDYRHDRTVTARRVVFSEAEAALFLTCHAMQANPTGADA